MLKVIQAIREHSTEGGIKEIMAIMVFKEDIVETDLSQTILVRFFFIYN